MKPFTRLANRYWIGGTLLAFVGVSLARGIAPLLERQPRALTAVAGQLLALGGLGLICYGVSRRLRDDTSKGDAT